MLMTIIRASSKLLLWTQRQVRWGNGGSCRTGRAVLPETERTKRSRAGGDGIEWALALVRAIAAGVAI